MLDNRWRAILWLAAGVSWVCGGLMLDADMPHTGEALMMLAGVLATFGTLDLFRKLL